jgi:glycosyltransferase involved in cell wall biosynthesis
MNIQNSNTPDSLEDAPTNGKSAAVIYTHSLLEGSMTFIKSQAEALENYYPVYAGAHRVDGIPLPEERTYAVNDGTLRGTIREALFRQMNWAPTILKNLKRHHPQIVHAHFGTCGPAGLTLARGLRIPLLVTFHGHDATMNREEALKTYRGRELLNKKAKLIAEAGGFIAVSEYIRRRLIDLGYPEGKIILHRNGIDLDFFRRREQTNREPVILFVGRFVEKKGIKYLIEAAAKLREAELEFELVLIGSGPLESELKDAASRARVPCRFVGFLPIDKVRDWLSRATVVAIPSVIAENGDAEGLPTTLLEAQAMETPVVATFHSGIPEGVVNGETAELVKERDTSALAEKLRSFLQSPDKAHAFGKSGRHFVTEHFDLKLQGQRLENIYKKLYLDYQTDSARAN